MIYADSSFTFSLYAVDDNTTRAVAVWNDDRRRPLLMTAWQELELVNTLRLAQHRAGRSKLAVKHSVGNCQKTIAEDFKRGILRRVEAHWPSCLRRASELSEKFSPDLGVVMLDIWHVATAIELGAESFWTFDHDQETLARKTGKFKTVVGLDD